LWYVTNGRAQHSKRNSLNGLTINQDLTRLCLQ
jgi:hypothetical protein